MCESEIPMLMLLQYKNIYRQNHYLYMVSAQYGKKAMCPVHRVKIGAQTGAQNIVKNLVVHKLNFFLFDAHIILGKK